MNIHEVVCIHLAGHLPQKQDHYREKFRSLVSTYLTFSPDGNDLLVNLGGEQIYLFDINRNRPIQNFSLLQKLHSNGVVKGILSFFSIFLSARVAASIILTLGFGICCINTKIWAYGLMKAKLQVIKNISHWFG